jgi:hypothetical protein
MPCGIRARANTSANFHAAHESIDASTRTFEDTIDYAIS